MKVDQLLPQRPSQWLPAARECAVDPTPIVTTLAPVPSSSTATSKPASFLERHVDELVAAAAGMIALALSEYQDRGVTTRTKMANADAIFQLFRLRQSMIGTWDFDTMARTHGRAVLRECCGSDVTDATVDMLVDATLEILRKVTRGPVELSRFTS